METPHAFPNPGGVPFTPDGTEYKLKLGAGSPTPLSYWPQEFFAPPVFMQNQEPDCGANAGVFAAAQLDETPNQRYSPDYQWIDIKTFDGFPLDVGTDMKSIFKSLKNGSVPYAVLPEETSLALKYFSSTSRITPAMKAEAAKHTIAAYGFHTEPLTFQALKDLIYANKVVVILMNIGNEFWTAPNGVSSWKEKDILPLRPPKSVVSGHFVVLGAFDATRIYFANWWSKDWGMSGFGYFEENYLPQILQVGTLVDSVGNVVLPAFTRDLTIGSTGADVTALQRYLNAHGYAVAPAGQPGSKGFETNYFGTATQAAVSKLQKANGISPTAGYFGPLTRTFVNSHA